MKSRSGLNEETEFLGWKISGREDSEFGNVA